MAWFIRSCVLVLFYLVLWFLLMGVAIFATQNIDLIEVKFINLTSIPVPLGLALVSSAGLGALALTLWQSQTGFSGTRGTKPRSKSQKQPPKDGYRASARETAYDTDYDDEDDFDDPVDDDWD